MDDDLDRIYARSQVQAAVGGPDGRWSRAKTLSSAARGAYDGQVAVSRTGRAVVVWNELAGSRRGRIMTASRGAGAGWSESRPLSRWLPHAAGPKLASLPSGELAVAWNIGGSNPGIGLRRWRPSGGWSIVRRVPGVEADPWWLTIGMDGSGDVTLAWSNQGKAVWVAEQTARGWSRSRVAPTGSVFFELKLEVNRSGDAVVGWDGRAGDGHVAQAAYRTRAGSWVPATTLSDPRGDAGGTAVAIADDGTATAAWVFGQRRSSIGRIQANLYEVD
jgi:hypothetical protein